jgi:hypothetical protein
MENTGNILKSNPPHNQINSWKRIVKRTLDLQRTNRLGSANRPTDWDLKSTLDYPASMVVGDGRSDEISPRRSPLGNPSFWLKEGE